jgi:hypothetical protein
MGVIFWKRFGVRKRLTGSDGLKAIDPEAIIDQQVVLKCCISLIRAAVVGTITSSYQLPL